jgi:hypothetical protein
MVDRLPTTLLPMRAFWLLSLIGLPLAGVGLLWGAAVLTDDLAAACWVATGPVALLAAAVLSRLVRGGRLVLGVLLTLVATGAWAYASLFALLVISCETGGTCLS